MSSAIKFTSTALLTILLAAGCTTHRFGASMFGPVNFKAGGLPPLQSVTVAWDMTTDPTIMYANAYKGAASYNYNTINNVGLTNYYTWTNLVVGSTYFFNVTWVATNSLESQFATEVGLLVNTNFNTNQPTGFKILRVDP